MPSAISPPPFTPLRDTTLFQPLQLGHVSLSHRVVQAPLTRMRAVKESTGVYVPGGLNILYYSQRASKGGLQLTEATDISHHASGYPGTPGVFTPSQIAGWRRVTDAVHEKGGFIFAQLWHTGRASPPSFRGGKPAISASAIPITGNALDGTEYAAAPPKPMTVEEICEVTREFADASRRALEAGFDGVEIHGANGYLLDQFLHDNVNQRTDAYGGSVQNRCRFVLEVIEAVTEAVGAERVGIRLSPFNFFQDTRDSDPLAHWTYLCGRIANLADRHRPAYVHMIEPRFDEVLDEQAKMDALPACGKNGAEKDNGKTVNSLVPFRQILKEGGIKFLAAGNFDRDNAVPKLEADNADAIVMGRWFIANPDLPRRLAEGLMLNKYDRTTFYAADPPQKGYTDYPVIDC
ncbi:12-oxophytodienoate reductase [Teratosphaeria nubilosa]|uniref:12-oxophytodienoate reductase n=1 Tax=Teratosphaeria nubilosa TaxID=161662 RepID=A0A6G1L3F8_9PEZI|nr:12-oxophytodienoate reductase [Teratosphaeria nubilosa]